MADHNKLFFACITALLLLLLTGASLINLTMEWGDQSLWKSILLFSVGWCIPQPNLKEIYKRDSSTTVV